MLTNECLPTEFALSLLEDCGFINKEEMQTLVYNKLKARIANFQQMAICVEFKKAIIAFHGIEITGEQEEVLKVVYESTKPFIMGLTVGACLDGITGRSLNPKDFGEAVRTITEQAKTKEGDTGKRMKGIIVKVSQTPK